jgi:hypothetical protein
VHALAKAIKGQIRAADERWDQREATMCACYRGKQEDKRHCMGGSKTLEEGKKQALLHGVSSSKNQYHKITAQSKQESH